MAARSALSPSSTFDLLVVGAGIMGLSHAAAAVAAGGGLRVAVVDRTPGGSGVGATVRNFGLLTSMYADGGVWGARAARSRELYESWAGRGWAHLTRTGALQLAQSDAQEAVARAFAATPAARAAGVALLDAHQARELCPALVGGGSAAGGGRGRLRAALHFPNDGLLEPRLLARGLPSQLVAAAATSSSGGGAGGYSSGSSTTISGSGSGNSSRVRFLWGDAAVGIRADGVRGVVVTTAQGERLVARHAVICTGDEAQSLLPALFAEEAPRMKLCKLQMTRLALPAASSSSPSGGGALTMPVTSGLSMRRYPLLAAACPAEHARMMAGDEEGADEEAERLGVHIIARPAGAVPRGAFGETLPSGAGATPRARSAALLPFEAVVGDSHQYASVAVGGAAGGESAPAPSSALDDVIDEGVTDVMLRVAGGMLNGVGGLLAARRGEAGGGGGGQAARVLQQWQGVYLQHSEGVLSAALSLGEGSSEGSGHRGPAFSRLTAKEEEAEARAGRSVVRVMTGIGGKGMTMSPALGEETVAALFEGGARAPAP